MTSITPIRTGDLLDLPERGVVQLGPVVRRNWSRVAPAADAAGRPLFVKQFLDATGTPLSGLFDAEQETVRAMASLTPHTFRTVLPIWHVAKRNLLVYEFEALEPLDRALDRDSSLVPAAARALAELVAELTKLRPIGVPEKLGRGTMSFQWKGLDVKNLALAPGGSLVVFDFGPSSIGPRSDSVARLVASVLVARWGRSVRNMVGGPPPWATALTAPLRALTTSARVEAELAKHRQVRTDEPRASRAVTRSVMRPLTTALTAPYWLAAAHWVAQQRDWDGPDAI